MASEESWIIEFAGRPRYIGPKWDDLDEAGKIKAIRICAEHGITSNWDLAVLLEARGAKRKFSRNVIGGFIDRHRGLFTSRGKTKREQGRRSQKRVTNSAFRGPSLGVKKRKSIGAENSTIKRLPVILAKVKNPREIPDNGFCKWPVGDPRDRANFRYCWTRTPSKVESYCEAHKAL